MLTEKIVFCIVMVPTLWIFYGIAMWTSGYLSGPAITIIMLSMPLFAYAGIVVSEAGIVEYKDLRPYLLRLFSSNTRRRLAELPHTREVLQQDLKSFIKSIGPSVGEIYYGKDLDWAAIQAASKKHEKEGQTDSEGKKKV
jgi:glycerol-3-phosphate O-acyltransferase / dihydroxyacetone phosphate acyltransferase